MTLGRIVLDLRSAHPAMTGIGRYALNLCLSLQAAGAERLVGLVSENAASFLKDQGVRADLIAVPPGTAGWDELELPGLLRRLGAGFYHSPLFLVPAIRACAYICTVHDAIPIARPDLTPPGFASLFAENVQRAVRRSDVVATVSEHSRRDLERLAGIPPQRIHVLPEAVAPRFRLIEEAERAATLRRLGLTSGYLLCVGALDRRKNLGVVLEILARRTGVAAVFVGSPSGDGYDLGKEIASRGLTARCRILGRADESDLPALYAGALTLIFPSLYEGFGLPVLEAMACGTPVLCSSATSLPEVGGDAPLYFDPTRPDDFVGAVTRLMEDPALREAMGARGLKQAARFAPEIQGRALLGLYATLRRQAA